MAESDQYYIEQCLNGRPDDFRYLVRRYERAVSAYLAGRLANKSLAEEAAQETFVRAYFGLADLKKHGSFCSWLLGIAARVAKEQFRDRQPQLDSDIAAQQVAEQQAGRDYELEKAIAELDEHYKEVILLRFYADQSCSQIAEKLNLPLGTVTKRLSRAYEKLRHLLNNAKEVQK